MENDKWLELVDRYLELTFLVHKRGEYLTNKEINDELTYDQHYTMRYIMKNQLCTSTDLSKKLHVKKSAITAIINRLVEKGFVQRDRDTKDRRIIYLKLTEKGHLFYEDYTKKIHVVVKQLISHFTEDEIETFMKTYEKMAKVLEKAITEKEG
ncbi:MAG: MarR family winged helix-turn-helix transcriptional regulator [Tuberibacillus sp.]